MYKMVEYCEYCILSCHNGNNIICGKKSHQVLGTTQLTLACCYQATNTFGVYKWDCMLLVQHLV